MLNCNYKEICERKIKNAQQEEQNNKDIQQNNKITNLEGEILALKSIVQKER
jgi:hypothetical protein